MSATNGKRPASRRTTCTSPWSLPRAQSEAPSSPTCGHQNYVELLARHARMKRRFAHKRQFNRTLMTMRNCVFRFMLPPKLSARNLSKRPQWWSVWKKHWNRRRCKWTSSDGHRCCERYRKECQKEKYRQQRKRGPRKRQMLGTSHGRHSPVESGNKSQETPGETRANKNARLTTMAIGKLKVTRVTRVKLSTHMQANNVTSAKCICHSCEFPMLSVRCERRTGTQPKE